MYIEIGLQKSEKLILLGICSHLEENDESSTRHDIGVSGTMCLLIKGQEILSGHPTFI